jgi:methylated-DNA-[protein]-cysteine S-methyltransferase
MKEELSFREKVYKIVAQIPKGKTLTYGDVAEMAGSPGASRAVGNIMSYNWDPDIPCHRVVRADGKPGGYNRGRRNKVKLLKSEALAAMAKGLPLRRPKG